MPSTSRWITHYSSPLGRITMASDGNSLTGLWFDGQTYFASTMTGSEQEADLPVFSEAAIWLNTYFSGRIPGFTPALSFTGSLFRQTVWELLLTIPYGETATYGALAKNVAIKAGMPVPAAQAVGGAVAHNPISLIVPCHRVIGADGGLTGYAGGLDKKRWLLALEEKNHAKV